MRHVAQLATAVVAAAVSIAACSVSETGPGPEAPPLQRLEAAPAPPPGLVEDPPEAPHLDLAILAQDPSSPSDSVSSAHPSCPDAMVLIEGEYCTEVREDCIEWLEPPSNSLARCAKFAPSVCVGERVKKRYCVDRDEYAAAGQTLPLGDVSWTQARDICEGQNKRLCMETEWEFACEGEAMLPYTTGYERDAASCNFDKAELVDKDGKLRDQREPASKLEHCVSPFGVRNMSGNVDEWVWRDRSWGEWRSAMKGGWWMPARDRCRPATTAHDERFHELQTGFRCCADAG
jgi:sulfatase modifying factor 1